MQDLRDLATKSGMSSPNSARVGLSSRLGVPDGNGCYHECAGSGGSTVDGI